MISRFESSRLFTRRFPWIPDARYTRSWNFSSFMLVYCRGRSWNEMLTLPACKRTRDEISSFRGNRDSASFDFSDPNFPCKFSNRKFSTTRRKSFDFLVCRSISSRRIQGELRRGYVQLSTLFEHNARWWIATLCNPRDCRSILHGDWKEDSEKLIDLLYNNLYK